MVNERDWLRRHVGELTAQQERGEAKPWAVSDAPDSYIDVMLRGIVGFRFVIARWKHRLPHRSLTASPLRGWACP